MDRKTLYNLYPKLEAFSSVTDGVLEIKGNLASNEFLDKFCSDREAFAAFVKPHMLSRGATRSTFRMQREVAVIPKKEKKSPFEGDLETVVITAKSGVSSNARYRSHKEGNIKVTNVTYFEGDRPSKHYEIRSLGYSYRKITPEQAKSFLTERMKTDLKFRRMMSCKENKEVLDSLFDGTLSDFRKLPFKVAYYGNVQFVDACLRIWFVGAEKHLYESSMSGELKGVVSNQYNFLYKHYGTYMPDTVRDFGSVKADEESA